MPLILIILFLLTFMTNSGCGPVKFSAKNQSSSDGGNNGGDNGGGSGGTTQIPDPGLPPDPPPIPSTIKPFEYNGVAKAPDNKVDVLLIVDDSNSMLADNAKLGAKLGAFVTALQNSTIDWQMCATTTRQLLIDPTLNKRAWGASISWQKYTPPSTAKPWVLVTGTPKLDEIFASTMLAIGAGWQGSDDERGIKAAWWHLYNGDPHFSTGNSCYRKEASLAAILISDEDERSVGGDKTIAYYPTEYQALENDDLPETLVQQVKDVFGTDKRFTFNSIIVKPADIVCMGQQDNEGSKSHMGKKYAELSAMTGGGVGSICDTDYNNNINYFRDKIISTLSSVPLECVPIETPIVTITPAIANLKTTQNGINLTFNPQIPAGSAINIKYKCNVTSSTLAKINSRLPASSPIGENNSGQNENGFLSLMSGLWNKILSLFK